MNEIIQAIKPEIKKFEDIIILDLSGKVVASTNNIYLGTNHNNDTYFY